MNNKDVPYIVHEGMLARQERTIRRLWILCIIIFSAFVISNGMWIYYESQYQTTEVSQEVTQDSSTNGTNNFVGVNYGETDSEN